MSRQAIASIATALLTLAGVALAGFFGAFSQLGGPLSPDADALASPGRAPGATCDYFLAPTGTDSGDGPWRSVAYASAQLEPGETLCARGGRYVDHGEPSWQSSGTAESPVTFRAYPGETPVFSDAAWSHGLIVSGQSHVVISGLTFGGYGRSPSGDGAILLLDSTNVTVEDCVIRDTGDAPIDHSIYVNGGTEDITIRGCTLHNSAGTHIHLNHAPGPQDVLIDNNVIGNPDGSETAYAGVVVGCTATNATATVRDNVFRGVANNISVCGSAAATVDAIGNDPDDTVER